MNKICFIFFVFFMTAGLYPEEIKGNEISTLLSDTRILDSVAGKFINAGKSSKIYIINDTEYDTGYETEPSLSIVYITEGNKIKQLPLYSIGYSVRYVTIIDNIKKSFAKSSVGKYCITGDFNKNGLDEIIFFELTGMSFEAKIVEFDGSNFQTVLDTRPMPEVRQLEYQMVKGLPCFIAGDGKKSVKYQWSDERKKYVQVE